MNNKSKQVRKDQNWYDLYKFIEIEIMEYDESLKLNKQMVLRLKGLAEGKLIANRKIQKQANYSPECILTAFQLNKTKILNVVKKKQFKNQIQKFNYIMAIIENNINDVALMLKRKERSFEKNEQDTSYIKEEGMTYKEKKEKEKSNKLNKKSSNLNDDHENVLNDIW